MKPASLPSRKAWFCVDLPEIGYEEAWALQVRLVEARRSGALGADIVLLLEHPPVFTLGRRGGRENLTVPEEVLKRAGIPIVPIERGGNITYHGPGQLVGYPIIDLHAAKLTVTHYVQSLEELMIRTASHWGVHAARNPLNRGVWVGNKKLGSLGIAVRRGISFHGFAFNVNVSLEPFQWIHPCGLQGIAMTSMERELSRELSMQEVREVVKHHMEDVFGVNLAALDEADLRRFLDERP